MNRLLNRRICVAPMMDYTDRHFRYLLRLISPSALLYTEMVNAQAIVRGDHERHLAFDAAEHPVALQLGGNDPELLAQAARIGVDYGYDEINLNCGCPSDRVKSGRFGACLMAEPNRVADCVASMRARVSAPVTVKCRIGIEPSEIADEDLLNAFIEIVSRAGCEIFVIHARKAVLTGLTPKENREIPPLRYDVAGQVRQNFPALKLVVNGGIRTAEHAQELLNTFDGVMLGREICDNPYRLADLHRTIVDRTWTPPQREVVVLRYLDYVGRQFASGERLAPMLRPALSLYAGQPRARSWRRFISERATLTSSSPELLREALRIVAPLPSDEQLERIAD